MNDAFKSLTVSNIEILELDGPLMTVRIVAEGYAQLDIPDRVDKLTGLLRDKSSVISLNYAITFEPLTPAEFSEWYSDDNSENSKDGTNKGVAAKQPEL